MATPALPLPELTRRLQDERDALRQQVDELERRLREERAARSTLEHERELKELELLHTQQRSAQATQQLRDKVAQLERELEDETATHKMAVMARNTATQKNTALSAELKTVETRWKHELEKKEVALAEVELLKDELRAAALDRERLVQRTEADARRVRELWQQIAREHELKLAQLAQELATARQASSSGGRFIAEYQTAVAELERSIETLKNEKSALERQVEATNGQQTQVQQQLESERHRERDMGERRHQLELQLQELTSQCRLLEQREEMARRERELAAEAASKAQGELDDRTSELLVLKTEFGELLDRHERLQHEFKHKARHRAQEAKQRAQKLARDKRCAEELAAVRKREISGYRRVIHNVERKLTQVEAGDEAVAVAVDERGPLEDGADPARSSLCIYRH